MDDKLDAELKAAEEAANKSVQDVDDGVAVDNNAAPSEKTEITEDMRKKLNIPEKFKYFEDVVKWGSEAEKAKSRAEAEKSKYEKELSARDEAFAEMQKNLETKEKKGQMTEEEKNRINLQFQEDYASDPVGTMEKLFNAFERRLESRTRIEKEQQSYAKEEEVLKSQYPDTWDTEIKPALFKIASDRPYLRTISEVLAVYEREKAIQEKTSEAETKAKQAEKKSAFAESGGGAPADTGNVYDAIAKASSIEDLEKVVSKMK